MTTTAEVGRAFWQGRPARGSSVHSTGNKAYSYNTVLLQRLGNGKTIGNITKYSVTTSKHQTQMGVRMATYLVSGVPRGAQDLRPYLKGK